MRSFVRLLFLLFLLTPAATLAQNNQAQREVDERLASSHFQKQQYEEALPIYEKLYRQSGMYHHFNQYLECLIHTRQYDDAAKELKTYIRKNPNQWKSRVDLIYVYTLNNEQDKADALFNEILKALPENKNGIINIYNT